MTGHRSSKDPRIVNEIAALRDFVTDEIYEDLLRLAALVHTEQDRLAMLGMLEITRRTSMVQKAALGIQRPRGATPAQVQAFKEGNRKRRRMAAARARRRGQA